MRLEGKVAIILGGTRGIGARTAELFVAEGARVVIAGRSSVPGMQLASALGNAACFQRTDARVEADVRRLVERTAVELGRVDCVFNNAGALTRERGIAEIDLRDFDAAVALGLRSVIVSIRTAAPLMIAQGSGSIINMASIAGIDAGIAGPVYSTVKAAVRHLTRCAAIELGEHGVRVNSISPGPIATSIFLGRRGEGNVARESDTHAIMETFERFRPQVQPIPRMGTVDDVAHAAVYLASDAASLINGHDLVIDGGSTAGRTAFLARSHWARWANLARTTT